MARGFQASSSQYLEVASAVATSCPISVAAWFYDTRSTADSQDRAIASIADSSVGYRYYTLCTMKSNDNIKVRFVRNIVGANLVDSSTEFARNTWHHAGYVAAAADDAELFVNGASEGTSSTTKTPSGFDTTAIGRFCDSSPSGYFEGYIAEVCFWTSALVLADFQAMYAGVSPLLIKPESRVAYYRLIRGAQDIVGGYDMTEYNSPTVYAHPPMLYPGRPIVGVPAAAAAAFIPRPPAAYNTLAVY